MESNEKSDRETDDKSNLLSDKLIHPVGGLVAVLAHQARDYERHGDGTIWGESRTLIGIVYGRVVGRKNEVRYRDGWIEALSDLLVDKADEAGSWMPGVTRTAKSAMTWYRKRHYMRDANRDARLIMDGHDSRLGTSREEATSCQKAKCWLECICNGIEVVFTS